jgi:hypothetical protein
VAGENGRQFGPARMSAACAPSASAIRARKPQLAADTTGHSYHYFGHFGFLGCSAT